MKSKFTSELLFSPRNGRRCCPDCGSASLHVAVHTMYLYQDGAYMRESTDGPEVNTQDDDLTICAAQQYCDWQGKWSETERSAWITRKVRVCWTTTTEQSAVFIKRVDPNKPFTPAELREEFSAELDEWISDSDGADCTAPNVEHREVLDCSYVDDVNGNADNAKGIVDHSMTPKVVLLGEREIYTKCQEPNK